jgi:hypothetical protein|tara:strand:- start:597 stop:953 length:357 start_codon:yes stop_codon:yes gene_type:complete
MLERMDSHPSSIYGLNSEFEISYLNSACLNFSETNGTHIFDNSAWPLGKNIFDCIPDSLESYYKNLFESNLKVKEPSVIAKQTEYECSSPYLFRRFSMHLYPIGKVGILAAQFHSIAM